MINKFISNYHALKYFLLISNQCSFQTPTDLQTSVAFDCNIFGLQDPVDYGNGTVLCIDYLTFIYEIPNAAESQYCGNSLSSRSHTVWSLTSDLIVYFRSNNAISGIGFNCSYEFIVFADKK